MATPREFEIPGDLDPIPTMASDDEESFVVLCKSLAPDIDLSFNSGNIQPINSGPIDEGQNLITTELNQLISTSPEQKEDDLLSVNTISREFFSKEVQQKVNALIAENVKLRETIMNHNILMDSQHARIIAWKEDVQKTHQIHKNKFAEAKRVISALNHEKDMLAQELEKSNEIREMQQIELFKLKDELKPKEVADLAIGMQKSLIMDDDLTDKNQDLEEAKSKIIELENLLKVTKSSKDEILKQNNEIRLSLQNMETFVSQLAGELETKKKIIEELNNKIMNQESMKANEIKQLQSEVRNLRTKLCLNANLDEDLKNVREQLMNAQATITDLQLSRNALVDAIAAEQKKVEELNQYKSMKDECFALEQQVNIYKADFETERKIKEDLKAEKEQMMKDFLQLQKRNTELNEEIDLVRERGFEVIRNTGPTTNPISVAGAVSSSPQGEEILSCPICGFEFPSYQALETHVEVCIEMNASLP